MKKFKSSERRLLADTIEKCLKNKIRVSLFPKKTHKRAGGWVGDTEFASCFDGNDNKDDINWSIFVHESCHVDQLLDTKSIWYDKELEAEEDWLDLHTKGKTRKSKKIEKYFKKTMELELDCEKRAVEKIKKYKLNIDIPSYIKKGNVYLFSYYCFYHQKCWYNPKYRIYDQIDLIEEMPDEYLSPNEYWKKHDLVYDFLKNHGSR